MTGPKREADRGDLVSVIRTKPGRTRAGEPFDKVERRMVASGDWMLELVSAEVLGVGRPLEVYRAKRSSGFVVPWVREDGEGYCPQHWADAKIGKGACGLRCRACFLIGTHRTMANPARHLLYSNVDDCVAEVRRWLGKPTRRTLGLGTDSSDSLLYEGITACARRIVPLVASAETNPEAVTLLLLTKTANVRYLEGLPTANVVVSFSLNPEAIADLWEGKFDDGVRVTPPVGVRLDAARRAERMGFEVRWRVDPVLTPPGWEALYAALFGDEAAAGARPTRITLGTYRETSRSVRTMARQWGLPELEWLPDELVKEGMHYHVPRAERIAVYRTIRDLVADAWKGADRPPIVALCKEPLEVRRGLGLVHDLCNCGPILAKGAA